LREKGFTKKLQRLKGKKVKHPPPGRKNFALNAGGEEEYKKKAVNSRAEEKGKSSERPSKRKKRIKNI